jgi:hypothetical protein
MKYLLAASLLFVGAAPTFAFTPEITEITRPYEIVTIDKQAVRTKDYLGELAGFPVMYEVTSDEPFILQARVQQLYQSGSEPAAFYHIPIKQNQRRGRVTEVARLRPDPSDWQRVKDSQLGFSLWEGTALLAEVEPGTYRIEVSTPENLGKYLLSFGNEAADDGYFETLSGVRRTQQFFGFSFFKLLSSSQVYYPLGIILGLFIIQRGWKYRKLITQNDT